MDISRIWILLFLAFMLLSVGCSSSTDGSDVSSAARVTDNGNVSTPASVTSDSVGSAKVGTIEKQGYGDVKTSLLEPRNKDPNIDSNLQEMVDVSQARNKLSVPTSTPVVGQDENALTDENRPENTPIISGEFEIVNYL